MCPKCHISMSSGFNAGGLGRWRRCAAMRSGGASNVTTGTPNVRPMRLASAPPREWPVSHIVALGYVAVTL